MLRGFKRTIFFLILRVLRRRCCNMLTQAKHFPSIWILIWMTCHYDFGLLSGKRRKCGPLRFALPSVTRSCVLNVFFAARRPSHATCLRAAPGRPRPGDARARRIGRALRLRDSPGLRGLQRRLLRGPQRVLGRGCLKPAASWGVRPCFVHRVSPCFAVFRRVFFGPDPAAVASGFRWASCGFALSSRSLRCFGAPPVHAFSSTFLHFCHGFGRLILYSGAPIVRRVSPGFAGPRRLSVGAV